MDIGLGVISSLENDVIVELQKISSRPWVVVTKRCRRVETQGRRPRHTGGVAGGYSEDCRGSMTQRIRPDPPLQ